MWGIFLLIFVRSPCQRFARRGRSGQGSLLFEAEYNGSFAWRVDSSDGQLAGGSKEFNNYVRAFLAL